MKEKRVKNTTFILYPETGFELAKLEEYIRKTGYKAAISPLHTPDEDEKKPHYHVVIALSSPRQLSSLSQEFSGATDGKTTLCMPVGDMGALNRYLTHEDNPEKQQFNEKPRIYNGYQYEKYVFRKYSDADCSTVIAKIYAYIAGGEILCYADLIAFASSAAEWELVDYCINHAYAVNLIVGITKGAKKNDRKNQN